ncbi:hypothetical protein N7526_009815 [Penicillium atrosanguineum]|nr:hypothetical protein N7526_009815 [Penicillium atrosanguineum]
MGSIRCLRVKGATPAGEWRHPDAAAREDLQGKSDVASSRKKTHPHRYVLGLFRVDSAGESGLNILWPFVPAAIVMHFARPDLHVWVFALNYIAMVPSANLLGFAVLGVLLETALSAVVEIVLFMVLLHNSSEEQDFIPVIQAAILGSILANLLFCLGTCFFVGGLRRNEQVFHEAVSEVGTGLLLVAGLGLLIPSAFYTALKAVQLLLFFSSHFFVYLVFNLHSHNSIFDEIFESDEAQDEDRNQELLRAKLTFFECIVAIVIS